MTAEAALDLVASVPDLQATDQYLFPSRPSAEDIRLALTPEVLYTLQGPASPGVESVRDL